MESKFKLKQIFLMRFITKRIQGSADIVNVGLSVREIFENLLDIIISQSEQR